MQAFVVRPFGVKSEIDFDAIHMNLIGPALGNAEITGGTSGVVVEAGNIRDDMFQLLLSADLVVADISIPNPNVYYELGIRHALRPRQTFLIRAKGTSEDVPFDLKTDRYLAYDPKNPASSVGELTQALKITKVSDRIDSPVFRSLPKLKAPAPDELNPVPLDFVNEAEQAAASRQGGKLGLLAWEAGRYFWEIAGLRVIAREQFDLAIRKAARDTYERVIRVYPDDIESNLKLGTLYQRLGDLVLSDHSLERIASNAAARPEDLAEALSLMARNDKERGHREWTGLQSASDRRAATLRSKFFICAWEKYESAFEKDLNHFYSGLNALSLLTLLLDVVESDRAGWLATFESDDEAELKLKNMKSSRDQLAAAVGLSLKAAAARTPADIWTAISKADYQFLTGTRDSAVATAYQRAIANAAPFALSAARSQLELFETLELRPSRTKACLGVFPAPEPTAAPKLRQAILFTGHMIDAPGRKEPRFPAVAEPQARAAIKSKIQELLAATPGPALGIAGGANGGDILFHEVCAELGVPTRMLLSLSPGPFISESVAHGGSDWVRRFNDLITKLGPEVQVLQPSKELPRWMREMPGYDVWQRTNIWLLNEAIATGCDAMTLVALWDGKSGDGPGGTKHMAELAAQRGITVQLLLTSAIFA